MSQVVLHTPISELVEERPSRAFTLYQYGVPHSLWKGNSIFELFQRSGLSNEPIAKALNDTDDLRAHHPLAVSFFKEASAVRVVQELQSAHRYFMRVQLPCIHKMIQDINPQGLLGRSREAVEILQGSFQMFMEDFSRHMLEEEGELFQYIHVMDHMMVHRWNFRSLSSFILTRDRIATIAFRHLEEDDEMKSIRDLTDKYRILPEFPLLLKAVYSELKQFERELNIHARLENEILFPKAQILEERCFRKLFLSISQN